MAWDDQQVEDVTRHFFLGFLWVPQTQLLLDWHKRKKEEHKGCWMKKTLTCRLFCCSNISQDLYKMVYFLRIIRPKLHVCCAGIGSTEDEKCGEELNTFLDMNGPKTPSTLLAYLFFLCPGFLLPLLQQLSLPRRAYNATSKQIAGIRKQHDDE